MCCDSPINLLNIFSEIEFKINQQQNINQRINNYFNIEKLECLIIQKGQDASIREKFAQIFNWLKGGEASKYIKVSEILNDIKSVTETLPSKFKK